MSSPLISPEELARRARRSDLGRRRLPLDANDPAAGPAAHARSHIPGARYANLDDDLSRRPGPSDGRHPLPAAADFAARLGSWGVGNSTTVVAYDEASGAIAAAALVAARLARSRSRLVLDGGFAAWTAAGLPSRLGCRAGSPRISYLGPLADDSVVESRRPSCAPSGRQLARRRARGASLPRRAGADRSRSGPCAGRREPAGSVNIDANGRFRASEALRGELDRAARRPPPRELIAMCGSGVTACQLLLALEVAGLDGPKLYAGLGASGSATRRDPLPPARSLRRSPFWGELRHPLLVLRLGRVKQRAQ
jgi:thiosulfate/3-mercaptopyruvate sulfurtransferase